MYAKRVLVEEKRIEILHEALLMEAENFGCQSKYIEAKRICDEVYELLFVAYTPYDPRAIKSANHLVHTLIFLEEFEDAERYARVCYERLLELGDDGRIELGEAEEAVSDVMSELLRTNSTECGSISEAEVLARKAINIETRHYGKDQSANVLITLYNILNLKARKNLPLNANHDEERLDLLTRSLAITRRLHGNDFKSALSSYESLATFHNTMSQKLLLTSNVRIKAKT